jgi:hypothetical protein
VEGAVDVVGGEIGEELFEVEVEPERRAHCADCLFERAVVLRSGLERLELGEGRLLREELTRGGGD